MRWLENIFGGRLYKAITDRQTRRAAEEEARRRHTTVNRVIRNVKTGRDPKKPRVGVRVD